jgi:hypothetical protein
MNVKIQKLLYGIAKQTCGILVPTTIKNPKRCIQKITRKYNKDTSKLCDIVRSSVVFCNKFGCNGKCHICSQLLRNSDDDNELMIDIKKNITQCDKFDVHSDHSSLNLDLSKKDNENNETNDIITYGQKSPSKKVNFVKTDDVTSTSFKNHIFNINSSIHTVHCDQDNHSSALCENFLLFINQLRENEFVEIVKIKNKYDDKNSLEKLCSKFCGGYRDILINIKVNYVVLGDNLVQLLEKSESKKHTNYIICELQLHSIEMYQYKCTLGHANYKKYRNWLCL